MQVWSTPIFGTRQARMRNVNKNCSTAKKPVPATSQTKLDADPLMQITHSRPIGRNFAGRSLLVASLVLQLGGCDQPSDAGTPGQKLDAALATGERKLDGLKAESRTAGERLSETASAIGDKVTAAAGDAGVTARVKTKLAGDAALNALKIDVDTSAGQVSLTGTAPNALARDQATTLAKTVDGVLSVDNRLQIAPPVR